MSKWKKQFQLLEPFLTYQELAKALGLITDDNAFQIAMQESVGLRVAPCLLFFFDLF